METLDPTITQFLSRPTPQLRIGDFELVRELGKGGFAPVWLAKQTCGGDELRKVAVKLFSVGAIATERSRIVKEAKALCRVAHVNVVRFHVLTEAPEAGVMALVMELVDGRTVEDQLRARSKLTVAETLHMGIAIASALSAVHGEGLVHRDVKPSNIVEEKGGTYKLIDFGIAAMPAGGSDAGAGVPAETARSHALASSATTRISNYRVGTLGYIDPICMSGGSPTAASDLYALGATLYRCLSGVLPAESMEGGGLDEDVLYGDAPPIPLLVREPLIPPALADLVHYLLAASPKDGSVNASWVKQRLEEIRSGTASSVSSVSSVPSGAVLAKGTWQTRFVAFGLIAALTLAAGVVVVRLMDSPTPLTARPFFNEPLPNIRLPVTQPSHVNQESARMPEKSLVLNTIVQKEPGPKHGGSAKGGTNRSSKDVQPADTQQAQPNPTSAAQPAEKPSTTPPEIEDEAERINLTVR